MAVRDPATEQLRIHLYRRMTPQERIRIAAQMYEDGIANMRAAILDRHPDLSELALAREMRRRLLPRALFHQVEAYVNERTIQ